MSRGADRRRLALVALVAAGLCGCDGRGSPAELRVLCEAVPRRLDPFDDLRLASRTVHLNVFEALVRTSADGKLEPGLAESWANVTPTRCAFRLRRGVLFHDGTALSAEDVAAALERARRPSSLVAGHLSDVVRVEVADAGSLVVETRTPTSTLGSALTGVFVAKPSPSPAGFVGTGPYRVVEFQPGERIELERVPGYHGPRPFLGRVVFERLPGGRGGVPFEGSPIVILRPTAEQIRLAARSPRLRLTPSLGSSLVYLAFNLAPRPAGAEGAARALSDVRVRRAFRLALDLDRLIRDTAPFGRAPATQLVGPHVFGFVPELPLPVQDLPRARALLREAGFSRGFVVTLDGSVADEPLVGALARQLEPLGVRAEPRALPAEEFVSMLSRGESQLYVTHWITGAESGEALKAFLHTKRSERGLGLNNRTGYSNPAVDADLEAASTEPDVARRLFRLQSAMRRLMDDLPWVPLFVENRPFVGARELSFPARRDGMLVLSQVGPARD